MMAWSVWILSAALGLGALSPAYGAERAQAGPLTNPDSTAKPKKSKKKKKKKKKNKGHSSSEASGSSSDESSSKKNELRVPAWGNADFVAIVGGGASWGNLVESSAQNAGCADGEIDCATGWGSHYTAGIALPVASAKRSMFAPSVTWARHTVALQGDRPAGQQAEPATRYAMQVSELRFGFLMAGKMSRKKSWGGKFRGDLGVARGSASAWQGSATGDAVEDRLRGMAFHVDGGFTFSPSKHVHLVATPIGVSWFRFRPSDDLFPDNSDRRVRTFIASPQLEVMVAF